ncbi:MAG: class I SAM-dependent methyltransferase [Burkholderiaceae bacterium]
MGKATHAGGGADPWVMRWLEPLAAGATMLDFASGSGRHALAAAKRGLRVTAVDRDAQALATMSPRIERICVDLEAGPWPLGGRRFDAIVVTNYLHRARMALLFDALAPGGRLIHATFAQGNERFGRPRSPDFLLRPGELLDRCRMAGLMVLAYEHGLRREPAEAIVQRVCAVRPTADTAWPGRLD